ARIASSNRQRTTMLARVTRAAGVLAALTIALAAAAPASGAALPRAWPDRFEIGVADQPGGAGEIRRHAPFGFRYQYLTGGANTGSGWATWNERGTFVSRYIAESRAAGVIPVFT